MSLISRSHPTRAQAASILCGSLLAFLILSWWTVRSQTQSIQDETQAHVEAIISGAATLGVSATVDGRTVRLEGSVATDEDRHALVGRVERLEAVTTVIDELSAYRAPALPARGPSRPPEPRPRPEVVEQADTSKQTPPTSDPVETPSAPARQLAQTAPPDSLHFNNSSSSLSEAHARALDQIAQRINSSDETVLLVGHATDAGTPWGNHDLSLDRVESVARALRNRGVPASRIRSRPDGDIRAGANNSDRLVEIIVVSASNKENKP